jgi:hypothetical protein
VTIAGAPTVIACPASKAWRVCVNGCVATSTRCSATMIRLAWFPIWRRLAFAAQRMLRHAARPSFDLSCWGRRRAFLSRRQHRKSGRGYSTRPDLYLAVSHPRNLPAGRARRLRPDAERTYARRADLLARRHSDLARSQSAPRLRRWRMATCGHGGLYLSWGRAPPSSPCASTIGQRSRCTSLCAASLSRDDPTAPTAKKSRDIANSPTENTSTIKAMSRGPSGK